MDLAQHNTDWGVKDNAQTAECQYWQYDSHRRLLAGCLRQ